jgi:cell division protein ZapD
MHPEADCFVFEQPLNERTRSFLRLQFLLSELDHCRADRSDWGVRAAVRTLLDTLSVLGRSDLKTELLKDLTEQQAALQRIGDRADVNREKLRVVLAEITAAISTLQRSTSSNPAILLRENDFLYGIHSRSAIPGGTCMFDLPAYAHWLSREPSTAQRDLDTWVTRLQPYSGAVDLGLRLLRGASQPVEQIATGGVFLHVPQAHYSLVRVHLPREVDVYPEISASRHRISVRFMRLGDVDKRHVQETGDVRFWLQCCSPAGGVAS